MGPARAQRRTRAQPRARALPRGAWALLEGVQLAEPELVELEGLRERACQARFVFEPLLEGVRVLVARHGDSVHIVSAAKRSLTRELPSRVQAIAASALPELFVAEALLVALDASGRPSLEALKRALSDGKDRDLLLIFSDLLREGAAPAPNLSFEQRRARLTSFSELPAGVTLMTQLGEDFELAQRAMLAVGLDGLVARSADAAQAAGLVARRLPAEARSPTSRSPTSLSPGPKLTNAAKVLFPRDGLSKQDLFGYYADVAPLLLPLMANRPLVLQRWPDGIDEFMWYQHRVPPRAPDYLRAVMIEGNRRIAVDNAEALLWLVNQAAITFHGFVSREHSLLHPDWLVIDLDPPDASSWARVATVALAIRKLLELLEVESVVKTSGQKGLHIVVPLAAKQEAASVKLVARRLADLIERLLPNETTQESEREKRRGRIFLDTNQGHVGKTLVLPYSLRGTDGATVSTPLRWSEVTPSLDPRAFCLRTLRARLEREGDLAQPLQHGKTEVEPLLARLEAS
jgi:DNA ligase D-like protein (predicted polymerase)